MTFDRIEMTQTIEQLQAKVAKLEEFKANVVKECASIIKHAHKDIAKQLAASQAYAEQLREALENHSGNYKLSKAECKIINDLLDKPRDTSALNDLVEKVEKIWREKCANACGLIAEQPDHLGATDCEHIIEAMPTGQIKLEELL